MLTRIEGNLSSCDTVTATTLKAVGHYGAPDMPGRKAGLVTIQPANTGIRFLTTLESKWRTTSAPTPADTSPWLWPAGSSPSTACLTRYRFLVRLTMMVVCQFSIGVVLRCGG